MNYCYWGIFSESYAGAYREFRSSESQDWEGPAARAYEAAWAQLDADLSVLGDYVNELEGAKAALEARL